MGYIEDRVDYGLQCFPGSVPKFHEACALYELSVAASRGMCMPFAGQPIYPGIHPILIAPSGGWKTPTMRLTQSILDECFPDERFSDRFSDAGFIERVSEKKVDGVTTGYMLLDEMGSIIGDMQQERNKSLRDFIMRVIDGECPGDSTRKHGTFAPTPVHVPWLMGANSKRLPIILDAGAVEDGLLVRLHPVFSDVTGLDELPPKSTTQTVFLRATLVQYLKHIRALAPVKFPVEFIYSGPAEILWKCIVDDLRDKEKLLLTTNGFVNKAKVHLHCHSIIQSLSDGLPVANSTALISHATLDTASKRVIEACLDGGKLAHSLGRDADVTTLVDALRLKPMLKQELKLYAGWNYYRFDRAFKTMIGVGLIKEPSKKRKPIALEAGVRW